MSVNFHSDSFFFSWQFHFNLLPILLLLLISVTHSAIYFFNLGNDDEILGRKEGNKNKIKCGRTAFCPTLKCKFHCPSSFCLCQPSPHIYTTGSVPLKSENSPHLPSEVESVIGTSDSIVETFEFKQECRDEKEQETEYGIKSSLRKPSLRLGTPKEKHEKKVQWIDFSGKELVEIREFEPSEVEDTDNEDEDNRSCICTIL